jgi:hypothetical protein
MPSRKSQVSPPFAARELNGERLLEELGELAENGVTQGRLEACVMALRTLGRGSPSTATAEIRAVATDEFGDTPGLSRMLLSWAAKVRSEDDIPILLDHFERMALVAALAAAARRANRRLVGGDGSR